MMAWKSRIIQPYAAYISKKLTQQAATAIHDQHAILKNNLSFAKSTKFGRAHRFDQITHYEQYRKRIRLHGFEDYRPYIDQISNGEKDILWPGRPKYYVGTSGTTGGIKYIPLTKESLPYHLKSASNYTINYCHKNKLLDIFDGKMIFLSGSPSLYQTGIIPTGRLSGIINYEIPNWLKANQVPSFDTNSIEDWLKKIDAIIQETHREDLRMISGTPPWIVMYFEKLLEYTGMSTILEVFPNFKLLVYGGVNVSPYFSNLNRLIGGPVHMVETYPASEGFIAAQNIGSDEGLLLNTSAGIFYEFVKTSEITNEDPHRLPLEGVECDEEYAIVLTTNAGLWSYVLGDTVRFISTDPYRLIVTGRINQFISAFGEHVVVQEVDAAIHHTASKHGVDIVEYSVAPMIANEENGKSYHEWFVEFHLPPSDLQEFAMDLDTEMQKQNFHYRDLIKGQVIDNLKLNVVESTGFQRFMEKIGKLGGQHKMVRISNDRVIADQLEEYVLLTLMLS